MNGITTVTLISPTRAMPIMPVMHKRTDTRIHVHRFRRVPTEPRPRLRDRALQPPTTPSRQLPWQKKARVADRIWLRHLHGTVQKFPSWLRTTSSRTGCDPLDSIRPTEGGCWKQSGPATGPVHLALAVQSCCCLDQVFSLFVAGARIHGRGGV